MNRRALPGAVSLAVIAALGSSGCGTAIAYAWPKTHHHQTITASKRVRIRGNLPGATVASTDGKLLGPAPYDDEAPYRIERDWQEGRYGGVILGGIVATADFTAGTLGWATHTGPALPWLTLGAIGVIDLFGIGGFAIHFDEGNKSARYSPHDRVIAADRAYRVSWPGFAPVVVTASVPGTREVVAARPTRVSFAQALLYWEGHAGVEPRGEALFELGAAHLTRAEHGEAGAATAAVHYLERYLEPGNPARAVEAQSLLHRARELLR